MVVNSLTMEDQSDDDFFDKLVDDEDVGGGSGSGGGGWEPSFSSSVGSNDVQLFENLGIEEVGSGVDGLVNIGRVEGFGSNDVVSSDLSDVKGDGVGVTGSQECIDGHGVSGKSGTNAVVPFDLSDGKGDGVGVDVGVSVAGSQEYIDGHGVSGTNGVVSYDLSDGKGDGVSVSVAGSLECIDDHGVSGKSGTIGAVSYDLSDGKGVGVGASVAGSQGSMDGKCNDHGTNGVGLRGLSNRRGDDIGASVTRSQGVVDGKWIDHGLNGKSEFDSSFNGNGSNVSSGIEEVQGNAFSGGTRKASFSNYFDQIEDDSSDPFSELVGDSMVASAEASLVSVPSNEATCSTNSYGFGENGGDFHQGSSAVSENRVMDQNSIEYWESLYPGWRYDPNTGQWLQVDGIHANVNNTEMSNGNIQSTYEEAAVNPTSDIHYLHHTAQSTVSGSMPEGSTTGTSMYWNQAAYENTEYPAHMVFDQNYPGWYYDTIAQEWRSLESYFQSINQSASSDQSHSSPYQSPSVVNYYPEQNNMTYDQGKQVNNHSYQLNQPLNWGDSGKEVSNVTQIDKNTPYENGFALNGPVSFDNDTPAYQNSFPSEQSNQSFDNGNGFNRSQSFGVDNNAGFQNFAAIGNTLQPNHGDTLQPNHYNKEYNQQFSPSNFISPNALNFSQQPYQNGKLSYSSSEGRSLDGRPPHALVSFGFGGKLVVMNHQSNLHAQPVISGQDSAGGVISILNVIELAMPRNDGSDVGFSGCDYIQTLCQQSFPSPLVSGNVGNKELNKWIDERITNCDDTQDVEYKKRETLKMVLSLLKIACQFYGKLRSFGADPSSKENDCPESALAKLFSSAKRNTVQFSAVSHCLHNMPSEAQVQAAAEEVQMLLVSGRRMEALQCAQQGHLWGPAIVIATLLGDQFYGETVKQMALAQLVAGSPLRTLCLLIAGQPAEVFSNSLASDAHGVNVSQSSLVGPGCMLDDWEENLAIISANRTNGDELVITHLGDCLWKERSEVMAAHICYLVAEANIELYSECSRLCLVGADHLKYPRTYASPQAIQRTELYEYAKVLGNSQFVLLPFQPYKLIYACMLAEVGKLTDSLKYCQAVLKSLKTSRSPEVDTLRHMISSLEERIKIHQQGGYGTSFGGGKLVGKLLNFFDNTAHRVVGGLPPPTPSTSHSNGQHIENDRQSRGPRVSTSQSTMAMSSLMTSASAEGSNLKAMHNRSMSEPNFARTPRKEESPKSSSSSPHDNGSASGSSSRLSRFGSQIFQKTVGLVLRARPDRQAKLGETNKFYYDENLKRWVEEGAESQVEEMTLAPPPTNATFINGKLDHDKKVESANSMVYANGGSEFKYTNSNGKGSELPPIPSASNHFSARGRMGIRSRYVDTFNKGGGSQANLFQSPTPSISAVKPPAGNPNFFIPTPVAEGQETEIGQSPQQNIVTDDGSASSNGHDSFSSPQMLTPVPTIQRYTSMDKGMGIMSNSNGPLPLNSNQTLSWGGNPNLPTHNITNMGEIRSPGAAPGF